MNIMNIKSRGLKVLLAVFLIAGLLLIPYPGDAYEGNWLDDYGYRKLIPIAAQAGTGTDYQVPLEVDSGTQEQSDTADPMWSGAHIRFGQRLTLNNAIVSKLSFQISKAGSPTGDVTFTIRQIDDTILASKVWGDASALTTTATWEEVIFDTPVNVNEEVRVSCEFSEGNDMAVVAIRLNTVSVKPNEVASAYEPVGGWDDETTDCAYRITCSGGDSAGKAYLGNYCTDFPNDIRFTASDGVTELDPFNKDEHNPAAGLTHWGIEVKADLGDNQNIYIYWGKSGASSPSDIVAASVFGDHFLGDTLDADKWDLSGAVSLANSEISLDNDDRILGKTAFGYGYAVEARSKADEQDSLFVSWEETLANFNNRLDIANSDATYPDDFDKFLIITALNGATDNDWLDNWDDFRNTYCIYRIKRYSATQLIFEQNAHTYTDDNINIPTVDLKPCLRVWDSSQESTLTVDWIFVRKYVYPEPVVGTPGSLETRERSWGYIIG